MMKKLLFKFFAFAVVLIFANACNESMILDEVTEDIQLKSANNAKTGYIVVLQDAELEMELTKLKGYEKKQAAMKSASARILKRAGVFDGEIGHVYGTALKGFSVKIPPGQLKKLQDDPAVKYVEKDQIVSFGKPTFTMAAGQISASADLTPDGIARVGGGANYDGEGKAWIIDSGIDYDHPDLNVDTNNAANFTRAKSADDDNGHGTHVAGTIAAKSNGSGVIGVAAGATVVPVKVLDRRGNGYTSWVLAGINYVASNASGKDVANMSLGGGVSTTLDDAVYNASSSCKFALAAGNEYGDANDHSPGRVNGSNIYTISAMDANDEWADFSNSGNPPIDFCEPGVDILSCYLNGQYAYASGTSMATPHMAGILLWGNPATDGDVIGDPDGHPDPIGIVGNGGGTDPTPNDPPTAGFTFTVDGLNVSFTDESSDSDGTVDSWSWDFGDGNTSTSTNPSHSYANAGSYTVTLTVADNDGDTDSSSQTVTVSETNPGGEIVLEGSISGNKVKKASLTWTGATGATVDIYKNSSYLTTVNNSGSFNENLGKINSGTFEYYIVDGDTESNTISLSVN